MAVSNRHILSQGPVIRSMGHSVFKGLLQKWKGVSTTPFSAPGPELTATLPPRPPGLVRDYVRNVGGNPSDYKRVLPPHLFPQWGFGLAAQTLYDLPYPLLKVMNGGCRIEVHAPLPNDEPLLLSARLENIDDNGRRAVLHQRLVTSTPTTPEALVVDMYPIVPSSSKNGASAPKRRKERPRVPANVREVARWRLSAQAGLDFAKLTGDFNPIHWIPAYAKASGFRNTILHGFGTLARTIEGLNRQLFLGAAQVKMIDVRFTRPLVLPAKVGLYIVGDEVFVGDAPGGPAYLVGTFESD